MSDPITIFRKTTGLNTKIDPVDLDISEGIQELSKAINVSISAKGRLSRRKGYILAKAGSYHSIYSGQTMTVCVSSDGYVCLITANDNLTLETTSITSVNPNLDLFACEINQVLYWSNGEAKGYISNGVNHAWLSSDISGPETDKTFSDPPIGTAINYYNGRIYIAEGPMLWFSEPYAYNSFDLVRGGIPFDSNITMICPVVDGIYVCTSDKVYFLNGSGPNEFQLTVVSYYSMLKNTEAKFIGSLSFDQAGNKIINQNGFPAYVWLSEQGICAGFSSGNFVNLTEDKLFKLPSGSNGSGMIYRKTYYGLIDS